MIKGSGSYINPLAKTMRGRTSGAAAGEAASMAEAMAKARSKAAVSEFMPAVRDKSMPVPFPKDGPVETYVTLPYRVPSDEQPVVGMPMHNNAPELPKDLDRSFDAGAADEMRNLMRKSNQPVGMRGAIQEAQAAAPSFDSFDFSRMSDMVGRINQPERENSYKRGGYVSKGGKLNLGSSRSSTGSKSKKSSNW